MADEKKRRSSRKKTSSQPEPSSERFFAPEAIGGGNANDDATNPFPPSHQAPPSWPDISFIDKGRKKSSASTKKLEVSSQESSPPTSVSAQVSSADVPHYLGHRQRLRERFLASPQHIPDYELLELVLFRAIPRADVKMLAKNLIERFGTFAEVVAAPIERLVEVKGVGESVAFDLKLIEQAARRVAIGAVKHRQALSSFSAVVDYCRTAMAFAEVEEFRLIFLDKKNGLIGDEMMQRGTVDHTPVYPREIVRRALQLNASAVILVHNHPSGDTTPSRADIEMTREIVALAEPLGICVHDHLIIGRKGHTSFRALGLL